MPIKIGTNICRFRPSFNRPHCRRIGAEHIPYSLALLFNGGFQVRLGGVQLGQLIRCSVCHLDHLPVDCVQNGVDVAYKVVNVAFVGGVRFFYRVIYSVYHTTF